MDLPCNQRNQCVQSIQQHSLLVAAVAPTFYTCYQFSCPFNLHKRLPPVTHQHRLKGWRPLERGCSHKHLEPRPVHTIKTPQIMLHVNMLRVYN